MSKFKNISFDNFKWLNEPKQWSSKNNTLSIVTDNNTDFWQETYYNFKHNSGHLYGIEINEDFTVSACIEADFTTLYDQAGLMIYKDEKHWVKAGIEYNDGQPMIGSVVTNQISDWATGIYPGNPRKFYLRLTKKGAVVCVKYSTDQQMWHLLRLAPFDNSGPYLVGAMTCTPMREGLHVEFSDIKFTEPSNDILHGD